jgi:hypothetical protein
MKRGGDEVSNKIYVANLQLVAKKQRENSPMLASRWGVSPRTIRLVIHPRADARRLAINLRLRPVGFTLAMHSRHFDLIGQSTSGNIRCHLGPIEDSFCGSREKRE